MDISQYFGVFIAAYFISHFLIATLYSNVPSQFRLGEVWADWTGVLFLNAPARLIIAATTTLVCGLMQ